MSNPFEGIISQAFKDTHKYMIDALLEDTALTAPCKVYYSGTKFTVCPNCLPNNFGGKSSNKYNGSGPVPFNQGTCPVCQGTYRVASEAYETLYLMAIWDAKKFIKISTVNAADIAVQTLSKITTYDNLNRATKIHIDEGITRYGTPEFTRIGIPKPIGFGGTNYIVCSWKVG